MATTATSNPPAVILDASLVIGYCAKEADKFIAAKQEILARDKAGCQLFAPGVLVGEVLFVLCKKARAGTLTPAAHMQAVASFASLMKAVQPTEHSDASLAARADALRAGFGCSRANDSLYLALAERLAADREVELITFDEGWENQAKAHSLPVRVKVIHTVTV